MKTITTLICSLLLLSSSCFTAQAQTYCTSRGLSTAHGYIKKVSMETINNTSGDNGGYADFTNQSATLQKGATYTVELTPGYHSVIDVAYWTVYIDYNHDGVFEPNEIVGERHTSIRVNLSFPVPVNAVNGPTRMRIQMQAGAQETNPCATFAYGEVEDYTVNLVTHIDRLEETLANKNNTDFNFYPNPATNNITVEFTSNDNNNAIVNVYNLAGQRVINVETPPAKESNTFNLNTGSLAAGLYILEMDNNGRVERRKLLISK